MARRPDDTKGSLIFQEGKCIEGDFYIIAVYDDPASCTISFSAYELENDSTYTYPLTYSEFDALFKFDSELMNPSNQDGRFHWVIERLDFVQNNRGQKVLCLTREPTPEEDDEAVIEDKPKSHSVAPPVPGGKIDAATRAKLLKELDTQDDQKLQVGLVKSESARKRFLADLHAKRQLEQLKAKQRLLKADEEREARLKKLDIIKQQQATKAEQFRANEEARKSTMAQLEVLMKQKEAQAIRRLIQEKDEQDRGMGREKDAARQRRKMQERSAAEVASIEAERAKQLARKRDDLVTKREQLLVKKNKQIAEEVRKQKDRAREVEVARREEKDAMIVELWKQKNEAWAEQTEKKKQFEALEQIRDRINVDRDKRRAVDEKEHMAQIREVAAEEKEATLQRRAAIHKEALLKWKIEASNRACAVRNQQKREMKRAEHIQENEEARLRKQREAQFLDTVRGRSMTERLGRSNELKAEDVDGGLNATAQSTTEMESFQRTYEQQERHRRHEEREERRKQEEAKKGKLQQLSGKDPNTTEILRIREWRKEDEQKKQGVEDARLAQELAAEKISRDAADRYVAHQEKWESLEKLRRAKSLERSIKRNEACVAHIKNIPIGTALPFALVY